MALHNNYNIYNLSVESCYAGTAAAGGNFALNPSNYNKLGKRNNVHFPEGGSAALPAIGYPTGYNGNGFKLPVKNGEMSIRMTSSGVLTGNLYPTRAMQIDFTGVGDLDATAGLVVSMLLDLAGDGTMTATIEGRLNTSIDFTGSGDMTANLEGLASMAIDLLGSGDLEATIAAYGDMSIDIVVTGTGLTTANVGDAVWQYLIGGNEAQDLLAAAGAAGDPWLTQLPGTYPAGSAGDLIGNMATASDNATAVMQYVVESGLTQEELLRIFAAVLAGKVSGAGTGTEVFRGINDDKDRVTATVDSSGNRTAIILDVS